MGGGGFLMTFWMILWGGPHLFEVKIMIFLGEGGGK